MREDPADRKRLARSLAELRARYRTMVEEAPEAIGVFDRDEGRFVEVNEAACRLYGLDRDALLHTGPLELSPEHQPDGRRSEETAMAYIDAALAGERPLFEWVHRSAAGRLVPCRVQLARVELEGRQLVRASVQDLSELVASARAQARLHRVLEASPDLVSVGDAAGHVLWMNEAGKRMLGLPTDADLAGIDSCTLHPEESGRLLREEAIPHAIRHGTWRGETELLTRDGRCIPLSQLVIAHLDADGRVDALSTVARDVSAQKALERRVLHAQKMESLGVMAGGVAHDFNNLLLGILGNASLLREDLPAEGEARQEADQIVHIAERAADLARQLLAYAGRAEVAVEDVDLSELARDSAELLGASVSKKVTVRFDLAASLPAVAGDPTQLRQVLMNLVLNAAEAIGDRAGEIRIRTGVERVDPATLLFSELESTDAGGGVPCVVCEVSDSGPGIPPAVLERIFDPFFTTKTGGRGLGLSALLGIVRSHRGGLAVASPPVGGARFTVVLPAREGAPRRAPRPPGARAACPRYAPRMRAGEDSSAPRGWAASRDSLAVARGRAARARP
ncbi:MAG: PAS domain S-box protein, partial [Myxococcota bacterium]|nr:PAS domain S-box protein [Myxococcota bacterium]